MMKCKGEKSGETGMLEYLEDVIGTVRYKKPLEQLNEKCESLSETILVRLNRLKIVESEMENLREPMEEAIGFLKSENTVVNCKNFLYQKAIKEEKTKVTAEEVLRNEVHKVQQSFLEQLQALSQEKKQRLQVHNKEAEEYEQLKKKKDGLKKAYHNADKKSKQINEDMVLKNTTRKKIKKQIHEEQAKLTKLERVPEESEISIKELEKKLQEFVAKKEQIDTEKNVILQSIQKETGGLQQKKDELQKKLMTLSDAANQAESAFTLAKTELKLCVQKDENEKNKLENLKTLYENNAAKITELSQQLIELKKTIPVATKTLNEASNELHKVKQEEAQLAEAIRSKRAQLEEGKSSLQATKSSGRVLDSLKKAKQEGHCPGFFGRLGDLGSINAKYDVAVSTACGPLDNLVVSDTDTAEWCIEYLKKHDIGRAVFIALDQQEHLRNKATTTIKTPENVPRLYDLIRVNDERVKTAFYYALRDTLVANDLDQASRIAYGATRYRMVTLKGDLIEVSGTMSGGGKPMRGRMGQSIAVETVEPQEIRKMEKKIEEMETNLRQIHQKQTALENQTMTLQPKLKQMENDLEKFNQELQTLKKHQPDLEKQVAEQQKRAKTVQADPKEVKKLTAKVEKLKNEFDEAAKTANDLQAKVDAITDEIKKKSIDKIQAVDKRIKDCTKRIDEYNSEIVKLKVAVKTAARTFETTKENISRMEQEVEDIENSLRTLNEQKIEIMEDSQKLLACIEETSGQLVDRENAFASVKQNVDEITKKEVKLKSEKIDIDEKLKGHDKKIGTYLATIHSFEAKLKSLKLEEIPEEPPQELKKYSDEELESIDAESMETKLKKAEDYLKAAKPNLKSVQEFKEKRTVYMKRAEELNEVTEKRANMRKTLQELKERRKTEFLTGYRIIRMKLKEVYRMITIGGDADFDMVDTFDPFTEGIQFNVRPPRKTWKKISNLSGGEKTLSSLALVFALHYYKPSPLYVMDEIDAALDFKNVSIIGNYIKERAKNTQFLIISLRSVMFELCDHLVGIYKTFNTTKSVTINPRLFEQDNQNQEEHNNDNSNNMQPIENTS
ncbi:hypothetical protein ABEB36_007248 [Hypothenemus hampei]